MRSPWHQTGSDENTVQFSSNDLLSDVASVCNIGHKSQVQLLSGACQLYTLGRHVSAFAVPRKLLTNFLKLFTTLNIYCCNYLSIQIHIIHR